MVVRVKRTVKLQRGDWREAQMFGWTCQLCHICRKSAASSLHQFWVTRHVGSPEAFGLPGQLSLFMLRVGSLPIWFRGWRNSQYSLPEKFLPSPSQAWQLCGQHNVFNSSDWLHVRLQLRIVMSVASSGWRHKGVLCDLSQTCTVAAKYSHKNRKVGL